MFIISFTEFFAVHRAAVGQTYLYFPSATIEMIGYLTMTLIASFILRWVEKKMDGPDNYVIHGSQSDSRADIKVSVENEKEAVKRWNV